MEKYCRAGHATDVNMAHAHRMLDKLSLQALNQNMSYRLLFHYNKVYFTRTRLTVPYIGCLRSLSE